MARATWSSGSCPQASSFQLVGCATNNGPVSLLSCGRGPYVASYRIRRGVGLPVGALHLESRGPGDSVAGNLAIDLAIGRVKNRDGHAVKQNLGIRHLRTERRRATGGR